MFRGLDSPRLHERVPRLVDGLRDARCGVDAAGVGKGVEDAVAGYDDDGEEEWIEGTGKAGGIGPDSEDRDHEDSEEGDGDVKELGFGQCAGNDDVNEVQLGSMRMGFATNVKCRLAMTVGR